MVPSRWTIRVPSSMRSKGSAERGCRAAFPRQTSRRLVAWSCHEYALRRCVLPIRANTRFALPAFEMLDLSGFPDRTLRRSRRSLFRLSSQGGMGEHRESRMPMPRKQSKSWFTSELLPAGCGTGRLEVVEDNAFSESHRRRRKARMSHIDERARMLTPDDFGDLALRERTAGHDEQVWPAVLPGFRVQRRCSLTEIHLSGLSEWKFQAHDDLWLYLHQVPYKPFYRIVADVGSVLAH